MKIKEILKGVQGLRREDIYYLVRCGYVGTKKIKPGKRGKVVFLQRDFEKIRLMWDSRQKGSSWEAAEKLAEEELRKRECENVRSGGKMLFVDEKGQPVRHGKYKIEPFDFAFETDSQGVVQKLTLSPDYVINNPVFVKTASNVAELLHFLEALSKKGIALSEKNLNALKFLIDENDNFNAKSGKGIRSFYDSIAGHVLKKISEMLTSKGASDIEVVPEEVLKMFCDLERFSTEAVNLGKEKVYGPDLHKHPATAPLFYGGVYGWTDKRERKAALGYTIKEGQTKMPERLTVSLKYLDNLFTSQSFRKLMGEQIAKQYGLEDSVGFLMDSTQIPEEEKVECLRLINEAVAYLRRKYDERFFPVQDSFTFYDQGISLYTPSSEKIFIFSTTSGLIVPEEYFGDVMSKKNPYRKKYFDYGVAGKQAWDLPKFYQWDANTTAKSLWKRYQKKSNEGFGEIYRESAIDILARFLQVPNLEISEVPFSPTPWKRHLTLNTPLNILLSVRGEEIKEKIAHGLLISQEGLSSEPLRQILNEVDASKKDKKIIMNLFDFVETHYQNEKHDVIKRRSETFENPRRIATEIVDILLDRGKKLLEMER